MGLTDSFNKSRKGGRDKEQQDIVLYEVAGDPRNVCFVLPDGKQEVFYYADVMQQEFNPSENVLTLFFRTAKITLSGRNLEPLFEQFNSHSVKLIKCVENRYAQIQEGNGIVVLVEKL